VLRQVPSTVQIDTTLSYMLTISPKLSAIEFLFAHNTLLGSDEVLPGMKQDQIESKALD